MFAPSSAANCVALASVSFPSPVLRRALWIRRNSRRDDSGDVVEDVAVDGQEIVPAVVIEIEEASAKAPVQKVGFAEASGDGGVGESAAADCETEAIACEIDMADEKSER